MTEEEIRELSNEALVEIFRLSCEQQPIREMLAKDDSSWQFRLKELNREIELLKEELMRRLERCSW